MTIYPCPICHGVHDTADPNDVTCPQTVAINITPQPVSPDESQPMWMRRYFCPQCPRHAQPRDGFGIPGLIEHAASHSSAYLREALTELRRLDGALRELEINRRALPGLALMYVDLALVRAFHHKGDGAFDAWVEQAQNAKPCPTCQATAKAQP